MPKAKDYSKLSKDLQESLYNYIEGRIPCGSFLDAVLRNDLYRACWQADFSQQHNLFYIVYWLCTYAPAACWGSDENVDAWLERKGKEPKRDPLAQDVAFTTCACGYSMPYSTDKCCKCERELGDLK